MTASNDRKQALGEGIHAKASAVASTAVGEQPVVAVSQRFDRLGHEGAPARLGIMGGTFDPIHIGHLACAEQAREAFGLDAVVFIPTGNPAHKQGKAVTPAFQRLEMCRLACLPNPHFDVSAMEINRGGLTYAIDTVRALRDHYPENVQLFYITGADSILSIARWKDSAEIARMVHFVAATRPGYEVTDGFKEELAALGDFRVSYFQVTSLAISSSELRQMVAEGYSLRYLTTLSVCDYIFRNGLYRTPDTVLKTAGQGFLQPTLTAPAVGSGPTGGAGAGSSRSAETDACGAISVGCAPNVELAAGGTADGECVGGSGNAMPGPLCALGAKEASMGKEPRPADAPLSARQLEEIRRSQFVDVPADNPPQVGLTDEEALSDEFWQQRKDELEKRVSKKRCAHSLGVAETAESLARLYGVDARKAHLAGLIHDWDKGFDDDGIRARVHELGLEGRIAPEVVEKMPQVLHAHTAAAALAREFPAMPADVLQAIDRHTTGAVDMTPLDMVIYIADCLEPHRRFGEVDQLRELVGKVSLEELFLEVYEYWLYLLLSRQKPLHPDTIKVWNAYAKGVSKRKDHKRGKRN